MNQAHVLAIMAAIIMLKRGPEEYADRDALEQAARTSLATAMIIWNHTLDAVVTAAKRIEEENKAK